jgi:signal transduction histidine kinase
MKVVGGRRGFVVRRIAGSAPQLRIVYLLSGSALALAFGAVFYVVGSALLHGSTPLGAVALVLLVLVLPTLPGLVPQLRSIEGAAAITLLGADLGAQPAPSANWRARARTAFWFWLHLLAGALTIGAVTLVVIGLALLVDPFFAPPGRQILGLSWAVTTGTGADVALVVLGPLLVIAGVALAIGLGAGLAGLARAFLGMTAAERIARLDAQTAALIERTRLARELHDSVGHALSVVVVQSAAARRRIRSDPEAAGRSLDAVESVARSALEDLDGVLGLLREDADAVDRQPLRDLTALPELARVARAGGHDLRINDQLEDLAAMPAVVSREAYRIVQEGLTNALRHAPGAVVDVSITRDGDKLCIDVQNPLNAGPAHRLGRGGRGLIGVAERVRILGGQMSSTNADGRWHLQVRLPLPTEERE